MIVSKSLNIAILDSTVEMHCKLRFPRLPTSMTASFWLRGEKLPDNMRIRCIERSQI